jgi:hypothetical protein
MESHRQEAVYAPESFDDPPRFLSGCVRPDGGWLVPVCCPAAAALIFRTAIRVTRLSWCWRPRTA